MCLCVSMLSPLIVQRGGFSPGTAQVAQTHTHSCTCTGTRTQIGLQEEEVTLQLKELMSQYLIGRKGKGMIEDFLLPRECVVIVEKHLSDEMVR